MQLAWVDREYVFGRGVACELDRRVIELIPFVPSDGTGRVSSYSLFVDHPMVARIPGELAAAQVEAERLLKVRFPGHFKEAAA